jgi:hypothetical protein
MKKTIILFCAILFSAISSFAQFHDAQVLPPNIEVGISIISNGDTTTIEPITYYKQKNGAGAFVSALTYGATKVKNKNFYKGKNSPNQVKEGDVIRFAFGEIPIEFIGSLYMFQPQYTIRNFSLCKFDVKKDRRELTTGEISLWGGSDLGVSENNDIEFEVKLVGGNIYEAKIIRATPGEYCFVFSDKGVGAYTSIFDFSVIESPK